MQQPNQQNQGWRPPNQQQVQQHWQQGQQIPQQIQPQVQQKKPFWKKIIEGIIGDRG